MLIVVSVDYGVDNVALNQNKRVEAEKLLR